MPSIWLRLPGRQAGPPAHTIPLRRDQRLLKPDLLPHRPLMRQFLADEDWMETRTRVSDAVGGLTISRKASLSTKGTDSEMCPLLLKREPGCRPHVGEGPPARSQNPADALPHHILRALWGPSTPTAHPVLEGRLGGATPTTQMRERDPPRAVHLPQLIGEPQAHWPGEGTCSSPLIPAKDLVPAASSGAPRPPQFQYWARRTQNSAKLLCSGLRVLE